MSYILLSFPYDFLVKENNNKLELPRQDQTSDICWLASFTCLTSVVTLILTTCFSLK